MSKFDWGVVTGVLATLWTGVALYCAVTALWFRWDVKQEKKKRKNK
jgi:hypothetical protein